MGMIGSRETVDYSDAPTVLIFADDDERRMVAGEAVWAMGGRVAASMPIAGAADRLTDQVAVDAVVVDVATDSGEALVRLLDEIEAAAVARRHKSVVTITPALIDLAAARAGHGDVLLLCKPTADERTAAIGLALADRRLRLADVNSDDVLPKLQQLSEEMGRIARTLATLSSAELSPQDAFPSRTSPREAAGQPIDASQVRAMIRARRMRDQFFQAELFADPAWDMLLDLMAAKLEGRRVAVSSLCIAAAVPPTTALRWIKTLTDAGIFLRIADPTDGRRVFIELSPRAADGMMAYLGAVQRLAGTPV